MLLVGMLLVGLPSEDAIKAIISFTYGISSM